MENPSSSPAKSFKHIGVDSGFMIEIGWKIPVLDRFWRTKGFGDMIRVFDEEHEVLVFQK